MGNFIKVFNDISEYNLFKTSEDFLFPNVSYVRKSNEVFYNVQENPSILKARYNATSDNMVCLYNTSNVKALSIDGQEIKFEPIKYEDKVYTINSNEIEFNEDGMATCPIDYTLSYVPKSWSFKPADDSIKISDMKHLLMIQAVEGMCMATPELLEGMEGMFFIRDYDTNSFVMTDAFLTMYNSIMAEQGLTIGFACCSVNEETGEINVFDTVVNVSKIITSKTSIEVKSSEIVLNDDGQTAVFPNSYGVDFAPATWQIKPKDDNIKVSELSYLLALKQYNGAQLVQAMPFADLVGEGAYFNLNEENNSVDASIFLQLYSTNVLPQGQIYSWAFWRVNESTGTITEIIDTVQTVEKPGGLPIQYNFTAEGIHNIEIELLDKEVINTNMFKTTSLEYVEIPDSVTTIGDYAFSSCSGLTSIVIPDSVTSIGYGAFGDCSGLTGELIIPDSVTTIGDYAFAYCTSLTSVTLGSGVTSIGYGAFGDCSGLTGITIPDSVTTISYHAFYDCSGLTGQLIIPDSVTTIESGAFQNCSGLTGITIPDSVTTIESDAFNGCSSLISVTIGSGVTSIGERAFQLCSSLTSINISDSVTSIESNAFQNCSSLTSVTIGSGVTEIGEQAFHGCSSLTSIVVSSGNTAYDSRENCNCLIETATNKLIQGSNNSFIPDSVTSIGNSAFYECTGLTGELVIPDSVTEIGNYAFNSCSSLTSVTIGSGVTEIGTGAFAYYSGLTSITCYATTAPSISDYTFYEVKSNGILHYPVGSDYSSWLSTDSYYLGYYGWTGQEL